MTMQENWINAIVKLAREFECCPYCGNVDAENHYCDKCKKRIVELDDAYWFSEWLIKEYKLGVQDE